MSPGTSYSESFPAAAESVPRARAALTAFARRVGARGERLDAIRLAASEAITNAVLHAYKTLGPDASHEFHINASLVEEELWILIADEGAGLRPRAESRGLGLGLVLIAQLADDFQVLSRGGGGTELRMHFKLRSGRRTGDGQPRGSLAIASAPA